MAQWRMRMGRGDDPVEDEDGRKVMGPVEDEDGGEVMFQ